MGFTLAKDVQDKVIAILTAGDWDMETAKEIPETNGMVLVKEGTKACLDRKAELGNFMIPISVKGNSNGAPIEILLFVLQNRAFWE